jgi:ribosomal protein L29
MAKTNFSELKSLDVSDIKKQINDFYQKLFDLKMQNVGGQLKDTTLIGKNKLQIARLKTLLVQKGEDPNFVVTYVGMKMAPVKKEVKVKKLKATKEESLGIKKDSNPKKEPRKSKEVE